MLLDYFALKDKYSMNVTGVILAGAHYGEELHEYFIKDENIKHVVMFEADPDNYKVMKDRLDRSNVDIEVHAIHRGLGPFTCEMTMYRETENKGQSNSVLKPKKHTQQYPGIVFRDKIKIKIDPLDRYECSPVYNLLMIDVQGFELEVLRGAKNTLKNIQWVLTEVNRDELYENCSRVEELDKFLGDYNFERKETNWVGQTWGDALYVKN